VPSTVRDVSVPLGEMMLFKSADEADSLRRACELSAEGHREAMRFARPGMHEYQVQAALEYLWRLQGSPRNGYDSIVASGANACVLHYIENDDQIGDNDLILIDAAAEVDGYSSDITRTFPSDAKYDSSQRAIYEIVLSAEKKGVELAVPGSSLRTVHDESTRILTEGMVDLGLLPKTVEESMAMHHYSHFFMHGTSHWLGLDVHDRGSYRIDGVSRPLEPGMSFTVEPGMYVAPDKEEIELTLLEYDLDEWNERRVRLGKRAAAAKEAEEKENAEKITHKVPEALRGIGVRIEDDILITPEGHENMTDSVPKEIDDVEALCAEKSVLPAIGGVS
jgi:Xaa-Pro aminopeptidase